MKWYADSRRSFLTMQIARLALLLGCLSTIAWAQERAPKLLLQGAQCLNAKKFLPPSLATAETFGYVVDAKSYPGQKVLYVVDYAGPGFSEGLVFAIFLTETDGRQIFKYQFTLCQICRRSDVSDFPQTVR